MRAKIWPGSIPGGSLKRSAPLSEVEWVGDDKAPKAVQPSPNPLDLRLPPVDMEPQINVTRNLTYLNQAKNMMVLEASGLSREPYEDFMSCNGGVYWQKKSVFSANSQIDERVTELSLQL